MTNWEKVCRKNLPCFDDLSRLFSDTLEWRLIVTMTDILAIGQLHQLQVCVKGLASASYSLCFLAGARFGMALC